jgi:spermidine/putrescine-binding protein
MTHSNKIVLICVFGISLLLAIGAHEAMAQQKPFAGQTLTVGIWSGPYAQNFEASISKPFEAMTGAKLAHKYSWDFTPEILAAPPDDPPVDVTLAADADYVLGVERKLWQPIRYANVPNAGKIFPITKKLSPTTEFGIPFDVGIHVLMYRKDKISKAPTSWADLMRDEFKGKIAIERWYPYWVYVGSYLTKYSPKKQAIYSAEGRNAIIDEMKKLSKRWFFCYEKGAEFISALDAGEILIGNYWNGSATFKIQEEIEKKGKAVTYGLVFPKEGSVAYLDHLSVVRGTKKRDLGEAFINYAMSTEAQRAFLLKHFQIVTNQEVVKDVPPLMKSFYPATEDGWKKIDFIDAKVLEPLRKELEERFVKEVLAK